MFPSNFIKELSGESDDLSISQDEQLSKSSKDVPTAMQDRVGTPAGGASASPLLDSLCRAVVTQAHKYMLVMLPYPMRCIKLITVQVWPAYLYVCADTHSVLDR